MSSDIRLAVSFRGHRKRKRLRLLLGPGSTDYLIDLWIATAMNHPNGILEGMDETDIALEAGYEGEDTQKLVSALVECGFLEKTESGAYALHDWEDHQAYVIHAEQRKAQARNAAAVRWKQPQEEKDMPGACCQHTDSNAPTLHYSSLPNSSDSSLPSQEEERESSLRSDSLSEPDGPDAQIGNSPAKNPGKKSREPLPENSNAHRLAVLMRDTLKANVPTLKEPDLQAWARSFAVALRNDERMGEPHFVAEVVKWACSDSFWRANIQSPDKLRKQFDQLTARMESEAAKSRTAREQWKSPAVRRVEANMQAGEEAERLLFGSAAPATAEAGEVTYDAR
ncbi:hypothetical protein LJC26_03710 [Desulfovibrio sp. OttesenSCG-928-O18]|nr:hypothetical protein [Desulfovibrio sp. OttesenSCG-928-O18]